ERNLAGDVPAIGAAEKAHREFGAAGAHQPGDADHLALAHIEVDVLDNLPLGVDGMEDRPVLDLEDDLADLRLARREAVVKRAADHRGDDAVLADVLPGKGLDGASVAD